MADLVDRVAAKALLVGDRLITGLAGATERAAKRAATTSASLKRTSARTRSAASAARGEDTGAWDAPAAAAARHYERRSAVEALLLCAAAGFFLRLLVGNAGPVLTLRALLKPLWRLLEAPSAAPLEAWAWLVGTGPRAARAAGGHLFTLPPLDGALHRLAAAALAALPSFEHSLVMARQPRSQPARSTRANAAFFARLHSAALCALRSLRPARAGTPR